jgi:hypothetical protein
MKQVEIIVSAFNKFSPRRLLPSLRRKLNYLITVIGMALLIAMMAAQAGTSVSPPPALARAPTLTAPIPNSLFELNEILKLVNEGGTK